jgi:sec-independent protein translocase protein TatC
VAGAARNARRDDQGRMSLGEHLIELRKRLGVIGASIILAAIGGWFLADPVWHALSDPILSIALERDRTAEINYTTVTEAFDTKIAIAVVLGIVLAAPVWLYQVWAFFVPALMKRERRLALGFLSAAVPLFLAGVSAGWFVLPNIVKLMTSFAPEQSATLLTAKVYLDFALKLVLAIGIGFVMPVFLVLLNFIGVLEARSIIKGWRIAIVVIALFTAIATPAADVVSMVLLAIPMVILYFIAAGVATLHDRRAAKKLDQLVEAEAPSRD